MRAPLCGLVRAASVAGVAALLGCASSAQVVRVIGGRPVAGEFVPAESYAAYLRGSIADAAGDLPGAIEGYAIASALGPRDPEPLARLGDARCRHDARDPMAEEALGRALAIDGAYAPALEARARCAERRGDLRAALVSARRAASADPSAVEPLATLARLETPGASDGADRDDVRTRLLAMTLVAGTDAAAWEALATWARGHRDAQLEARALAQVAPFVASPAQSSEISEAIARFEGEGELAAARALARARLESGVLRSVDPRIARLAIDDALVAGDVPAARRIATRTHLPAVVVAARALLAGDSATALAIASSLADAEPTALPPRLVLAAAADSLADGRRMARALGAAGRGDARVPPEAWLVFARAVARAGSPEGTQTVLRALPREPLVAGDAVTTSIAVALAASGALDPAELDSNGRVELAERSAERAPESAIATADARHRLLALARRSPRDPETIALARALAPERTRDPIVAVAFARLALAGAADAPSMSDVLAHLDPANPLVAAAALDCAVHAGDTHAIPLARARLAAVAHTPAERAHAVE